MSPSEKLRVLLIRDVLCFVAFTAFFFIPGDLKYAFVIVPGIILRVTGRKLKGAPMLESQQRQIYFAVTVSFLSIWVLLVLRWMFQHLSAPAIAMGITWILVLVAFGAYTYETILRKPTV